MRTSLDLCVCLLTLCGITPGLTGVKVVVEEGSDAVLPCSLNTKEDMTGKIFDWRKDGHQEVFFYDSGIHYNNGLTGQDEQFKGRVSHFQDQLTNGHASIKIHNTNVADSGTYSCIFPHLQPRQTFNIELVVGASPKPHITTLQTKDGLLLQCEVRGASPKPKVEWQDSAGNILPAEEPQVSERGGRYYVTLKTTVTKTDRYRCVATQEDISHQIHAETFVPFREDLSREVDLWRSTTIILAVLVAVLLLVVALIRRRYRPLMKMLFCYWCVKRGYSLGKKRPRDNSENVSSDSPSDDRRNVSSDSLAETCFTGDTDSVVSDLLRRRRPPDIPENASSDSRLMKTLLYYGNIAKDSRLMKTLLYYGNIAKGYGLGKKPSDDDLKKSGPHRQGNDYEPAPQKSPNSHL